MYSLKISSPSSDASDQHVGEFCLHLPKDDLTDFSDVDDSLVTQITQQERTLKVAASKPTMVDADEGWSTVYKSVLLPVITCFSNSFNLLQTHGLMFYSQCLMMTTSPTLVKVLKCPQQSTKSSKVKKTDGLNTSNYLMMSGRKLRKTIQRTLRQKNNVNYKLK